VVVVARLMVMCWCVGMLVWWCVGMVVCWYSGVLVWWCVVVVGGDGGGAVMVVV